MIVLKQGMLRHQTLLTASGAPKWSNRGWVPFAHCTVPGFVLTGICLIFFSTKKAREGVDTFRAAAASRSFSA